MTKVKYLVFVYLLLMCLSANSNILMMNTFEEYEGLTPQECGWEVNSSQSELVDLDFESDDDYQTQSHGKYSLWIGDPNDTSYANAYKTFTNSASEYMVEFYLWIRNDSIRTAHIDSFPLCVLWNIPGEGIPHKTDIALVLDTLDTPPNSYIYVIRVEDAQGMHTGVYLDSTCYDRWFKIQIYRHPNFPNPAVVDLYFDGDSIGTYSPMNSGYVTNKISFGTRESDSLSDGEVFYDDVIVTTPPVGEHPRLLFDSLYVDSVLEPRMTDSTSTISVTYKDIWNTIKSRANYFQTHDTIVGKYDDIIVFPFPQPEHHEDNKEHWLRFASALEIRLNNLSFYFIMTDDTNYMERAKAILLSLCNDWRQWTDPDYRWGETQYSFHDTGMLIWGFSVAYDILYDAFDNYERMNIQNALISLGLNQTYLRALHTMGSQEPWRYPNKAIRVMSGMGVGTLVTDSAFLEAFLDTARSRVKLLLQKTWVCDPAGGWSEGISYAEYAIPYLLAFMQADSILNDSLEDLEFLKNHPLWRLYCILPVEEGFEPDTLHYGEVNFSDYHHIYMRNTSGMYRLAGFYMDSLAQWYIDKRHDRIIYFFPFLWFNDTLIEKEPDSLPKAYLCDEIEWGILRSGWGIDDYIFAMKGDSIKFHTHHDRNSFIFGMGGRWFIEDWGYGKSSAAYHNVIIVNNDTLTNIESKSEISSFYGSDDYGYIKGDAGMCYDELEKWTREVIFLNEGGYFAIKDWVKPYQDAADTLRWQVHSYIVPADTDSLILNDSLTAIISKNSKHLRMEMHRPNIVSIDTTTPFPDNRESYKRVYTEIIDTSGIDSLLFLTSFLPYDDEDSCAEVSEIDGGTMRGVFIDTDSKDRAILFSKRGNEVKGLSYVIDVPSDSADSAVFNVLADLYVSEEEPVVYTIIDENLDAGTRQDTSITPTDAGTMSFKVSGLGKHRITVFVPGKIESNSDDATAQNSSKRFFYDDSLEKFHLLYEHSDMIMHGVRFSNIDGWVEGYRIGDGMYPTLASFTDTTGEVFLGAVWVNSKLVYFSRYTYASGWSTPCSLITHTGTDTIHYLPPSLAIDDSDTAHLAWGIIAEPDSYPDSVSYELYYSTFNARVDEPSISSEDTLDEAKQYATQWLNVKGYVSLDLYNDTISVVVWSRPIGDGKDTIYCKQETSSGWPSSPDVVSSSSSKASNPFCDIIGSIIHVVWEEEGVIKHRQRYIHTDWMSIETVSNTLLTSRNPQIVNGDICVYTEVPQFVPNHRSHVVYRKRSGQGTWGSSNILESTSYESEYPQSFILEKDLYVAWTEGNSAPYEVKYKKKSEP